MATSEVITWQAASEYIEEGTVESLGKLRRSEQQLTTYRSFMDNMKQEYSSVADFIKISVLERACKINAEGKKQAVDVEHSTHQVVWHLNDFPYYFEDDVQHWLLWATEPLGRPDIDAAIAAKFDAAHHEHLIFVNPAALQSVLSIWHCHVLVRPRRQAQS